MKKHTLGSLIGLLLFGTIIYSCSKENLNQPESLEGKMIVIEKDNGEISYKEGGSKINYIAASGKQGTFVLKDKGLLANASKTKSIYNEINFEFNQFSWTMKFDNFIQESSNSITYDASYSDQIGATSYRLSMEEPIDIETFQAKLIGEHDLSDIFNNLSTVATPGAKCGGLCFTIIGIGMSIGYGISSHCQSVIDSGVANCDQCYEVGFCSINCHSCE